MAGRTPGRLMEYDSDGRLKLFDLWRLFDAVAIGLLVGLWSNALLMTPPQHGKSKYWSQGFPVFCQGKLPNSRVVLGSYGAQYAASWGRASRDTMKRVGPDLFGLTVREDVAAANEWKVADLKGERLYEAGMITAGIEGGVAGRSADIAIADDLIADDASGESKTIKDKVWNWWEAELSARLQKGGKRIMMMTRRAVDDPPGRILDLIEAEKEVWKVIELPAIAEKDEVYEFPAMEFQGMKYEPYTWRRAAGTALVPELHPIEELRDVEKGRAPHVWAGLYQQRPYPRGGGDLKGEWFQIVDADPACTRWARAWDLAASESPTAKQTAGVKIGKRREGEANKYHIAEAEAFRLSPGKRNKRIHETAKRDGKSVPIIIEQEPGSGGPAQVEELKRLLDGFQVIAVPASRDGSKEMRAEGMAAQAGIGNFTMRKAPWNLDFIQEANSFPAGLIDMIDAAAHAYNYLAGSPGPVKVPLGYTGLALPGTRLFGSGRLA
jgi:predicted phage terminase large subunit-like protein